jgi:hypothetical protein
MDILSYENQFTEGNLPPGEWEEYRPIIFLELENSPIKWEYHSQEISAPQGQT